MIHERNKELLLDALDYLYELRAEWTWKDTHPKYITEMLKLNELILNIERATDE